MGKPRRKEWPEARAAYRRGEGTLREIAKRFGFAAGTLMKRAAREGWEAERQRTASKANEKAVERDVESVAAMLGKHRGLANLALRIAAKRLEAIGKMVEEDPDAVSESEVDGLTKVVARMIPVERLAAGIERIKPVKPVEMADDAEIVFEIDAPAEDDVQPEAAPAPAKA